jgi:hypothetical protein
MASSVLETKVSTDLLRVLRSDADARVDVLVELESPAQALQDSCDRADRTTPDRAQRASCVAESLQSFAARAQQPVKELLERSSELFGSSTFLWISNAVAVHGAQVELVEALARLDCVERIDLEQVFDLQAGVEKLTAE